MKIEAPVTELIKTRRETERKNWRIIKKRGGGGWRRKRMNRKYQMKAYVFPTRFWRGGWVVAFEDPRGNALSFNSFPSRRIIFSGRRVFTEVPQFFLFPSLYLIPFANETSYKIFFLFYIIVRKCELNFRNRNNISRESGDYRTIEISSVRLEFLNDLCGKAKVRKRW